MSSKQTEQVAGDDELDKMLWEFQLYVELHTPGMLVLLNERRAKLLEAIRIKYISREQVKLERLEAVRDWLRWASLGGEPMDSNSINGYINGLTENIDIMRRELGLGGDDNGKA